MSFIENITQMAMYPESSIPDVETLDEEYKQMYELLDTGTKSKIDKIPNKKFKQETLTHISNPELQAIYNKLSKKTQETIDNLPIRDKYLMLRQRQKDLEKKEKEKEMEKEKEKEVEKEKAPRRGKKNPEKDAPKNIPQVKSRADDILPPAKEAPQELFGEEYKPPPPAKDKAVPQGQFNNLVNGFYASNPFVNNQDISPELEVRFGTKGIKPISQTDYENVIKKLKSFGFESKDPNGVYYLRVNCEFLDSGSGKFRLSDIRTEIMGLHNIQSYCKNNDINELYVTQTSCVSFQKKTMAKNSKQEKIYPVNVDDFNFRVSHAMEVTPSRGVIMFIVDSWKRAKKTFRYLNRVTFTHKDYPFNIDISIVKYANKNPDKYGNVGKGDMKRVYLVADSNVFNNPEVYEIEIEVDNRRIGPGTQFNSPELLLASLRKVIKFILSGLQGTNYPISYPEQREVLQSYMKLIWKDEYNPSQRVYNKNFIGPNSKTLQLDNVSAISDNSLQPNIRTDFVVTEKADGQRHLLYINGDGKIYLINTNMNVIFTGAKTTNKECFNALLDGEIILHDKKGKFINLYAAFDIYYYNGADVRGLTFMLQDKELEIYNARYQILKLVTNGIKAVSIQDVVETTSKTSMAAMLTKFKNKTMVSPIRIISKEFYPYSNKMSIFSGCNEILTKVRENRFEYETDGLIFTHAYFGVGSDKIGVAGPKTKTTWDFSFKWKPPKFNTIDFLVTTVKGPNGDDIVKPIFEDGTNAELVTQFAEYKTIELRCGFNENRDGYINPCQDVIDDKLPQYKADDKDKHTQYPVRFYPTEPYDPKAGLCKIMLKTDETGVKQMFTEENDVFTNNTIVEFSYDLDREEGWRWVPLRLRYDKTTEYRQGQHQYGNAYKTCNDNWKSIHNPVTEDMICTGMNIPDVLVSEDKYYNTPSGKMMTTAMKNFHNLYVKKLLIRSVSKQGDTLVDFACGKAGDLPKWIGAKLSFVFGIDISKDNLENRLDGACARFLNAKKINKHIPYALFVNGNSAFNIQTGAAMLNDKAIQITKAVFGKGPKESDKIGKGVARQFGVGESGFDVASCQFASHYFFENPETLQGFLRNIAECTKLNGYFIGTAYDGKMIFNLLNKTKTGESIQIIEDGKKIWEITKGYASSQFEDDSSSIGYRIDVFQESINQTISEYLINFDYFNRVLENYGFKLMNREEAKQLGLPESTGLFSELFGIMEQEIKANKSKSKEYGDAINMTAFEKKISFLNRYFVYKKMREVNISKIQLELSEYSAYDNNINQIETKRAVKVARTTTAKLKPVVKKLTKKIVLKAAPIEEPIAVAAEAIEPIAEVPVIALEPVAVAAEALEPIAVEAIEKPKKTVSKTRKKLIIHDA